MKASQKESRARGGARLNTLGVHLRRDAISATQRTLLTDRYIVRVDLKVHIAHAAPARRHGGSLLPRLLGDHGFGGDKEAGDRSGALQRIAHHLGGVDYALLDEIAVFAGRGVVSCNGRNFMGEPPEIYLQFQLGIRWEGSQTPSGRYVESPFGTFKTRVPELLAGWPDGC